MSVVPSASETLRAQGIPHRRMEDWKYTDLRSQVSEETVESAPSARASIAVPQPVEMIGLGDAKLPDWAVRRIASVATSSVMEAAAQSDSRANFVLRVPDNVHVGLPLGIVEKEPGNGRIVLFVGAGSSLVLTETHLTEAGGLQNLALLIFLDRGARLTHIRTTPFRDEQITVETISIVQKEDSHYRAHFLNGGAKLSRTELNIELKGEGAEAELSGVSVLGDGAHADVTTRIVHAVPNTTSRQLFKYIAGGKSRAIYQGKITVKEGAIGSDSRQTAKALLLSDRAEADLKPELEILADDVKCAHGAAVGDLDADSLFYLRSRGIPEKEARALLIEAFLQEVIDGIEDETIRASAADFVKDGLARAMIEAS